MNGAREYCKLFPQKQRLGKSGRLFVVPGSHARGNTFRIYVLPNNVSDHNHPDAVEVYGVIGGNPGWSESYGWLHQGPWVQVFEKIVETHIAEIAQTLHAQKIAAAEKAMESVKRTKKLLDDFVE